ncbi:endopeptidase La [Desulfuribacillus alkaliarsenatis]|uniref:Lon protease n=1 Tax=Desulfuribacillus alkaliarsenatis TaxID=766136 RepID=A0A1E5G5C1_9FIRM|nr:endopeptidase La [Desulfuribacillus alkaliarsenatis]OEF98295.1 endopeptidase La [Desulfuribacillus alkaliarsenatis]
MAVNDKKIIPVMPLRGLIVYPSMVLHLDVGRQKSVNALEQAMVDDSLILLVSQKDVQIDDPEIHEVFHVGTVAKVRQMLKLPNDTIRVLVEGLHRAQITEFLDNESYYEASYQEIIETNEQPLETEALMRLVLAQFEQYIKISKKINQETLSSISDIEEPGRLADLISSHLTLKLKDKQEILEISDIAGRLEKIHEILNNEQEVLELEKKIGQRVKKQMEKTQKEYYLREQIKAIQKELGEKEGRLQEGAELREKLAGKKLPDNVKEKVVKEIERLEKMPQSSAEGTVVRNYIEWLLDVPWLETTDDEIDIDNCEKILNEDHYGLDKVKERILEYLAVQQMVGKLKGPIICFVGPPGVGKTSFAKSISRAINRKFVRISLGGVRDEAEIRGHRRTYVGAMPGRIMQGMKTAGTINPVFLLDEIDKMSMDFRGDPSAALLEVLDPEQNNSFSDHYIEMPYDLSKVMFITTANSIAGIPRPLLDRMELVHIPGYTELEKQKIAEGYLIPKQLKEHGLTKEQVKINIEVVEKVIREYTREAGVRNLERQMATLCRKAAKILVSKKRKRVLFTSTNLDKYLGPSRYRFGLAEKEDQVGVATGLAWTEMGGDTLSIEVAITKGKGKLTLTGKLGSVMQESAQAAFSYIRSRSESLDIEQDFYEKYDVHIHVPEGATPKDGPSAGISMATAMVSAFTGVPVAKEVAMTGEITLRGRVLPIGGVKEKVLSAHRAGITTVILPKENEKDLQDVPQSVLKTLEVHLVEHLDEVLELAIRKQINTPPYVAEAQSSEYIAGDQT